MFLGLTEEQEMIVESVRAFVEQELYPYEDEVERTNQIRPELKDQIIQKALELGFYAANMPAEHGGGGLDAVTLVLMERELGRANYGLEYLVARPSNILQACKGEQIEKYLLPTIRGEKIDCLAMSEPDAGSDVRSMKTKAVADGDDYIINGTKHFISHADIADYVILFVASGETMTPKGPRNKITCFLVDKGTPGFTVLPGYEVVSHRGYHNCILQFDDCRVPASNILGELHHGFDVANEWLASTRLSVAATCLGTRLPSPRTLPRMGRHAQTIWSSDWQIPRCLLQAGRYGHRIRRRRAANPQSRLEIRSGHCSKTKTLPKPNSTPPKCLPASPTTPCKSSAAWDSPTNSPSPACGATPASNASGTAPAKYNDISSRERCCDLMSKNRYLR